MLKSKTKSYRDHIKDYLTIVWPIMINLLSFVFISLADKLMIGRLGKEALVGASSVNLLAFVPLLLSVGCCTVLPSIVAAGHYKKSYQEATHILYTMLLVCGSLAFLFALCFICKPQLLLRDMPSALFEKVKGFYWTISFSAVFGMLVQPMRKYLEGLSWFRFNMGLSLVGGAANIVLNALFIYGYFGLPAFGVTGAGIATLLVRVVVFFIYIFIIFVFLKRKGQVLPFRDFWKNVKAKKIWGHLKISLPGGVELMVRAVFYGLADRLFYKLYQNQVEIHAAGTILFDIIRYTNMVALASAITSTVLMARAVAKGEPKEQRRLGLVSYPINLILALIAAFIGYLCYPYMLWIVESTGAEPLVNKMATQQMVAALIGYAAAIQIADSLTSLGICLLRGKKDVVVPVLLYTLALSAVGMPTSYILGVTYQWGIKGILMGLLLGFSLAAIFLFFRLWQSLGGFVKHPLKDKQRQS